MSTLSKIQNNMTNMLIAKNNEQKKNQEDINISKNREQRQQSEKVTLSNQEQAKVDVYKKDSKIKAASNVKNEEAQRVQENQATQKNDQKRVEQMKAAYASNEISKASGKINIFA